MIPKDVQSYLESRIRFGGRPFVRVQPDLPVFVRTVPGSRAIVETIDGLGRELTAGPDGLIKFQIAHQATEVSFTSTCEEVETILSGIEFRVLKLIDRRRSWWRRLVKHGRITVYSSDWKITAMGSLGDGVYGFALEVSIAGVYEL